MNKETKNNNALYEEQNDLAFDILRDYKGVIQHLKILTKLSVCVSFLTTLCLVVVILFSAAGGIA